jgi:predicted cobalt transporter CbtA
MGGSSGRPRQRSLVLLPALLAVVLQQQGTAWAAFSNSQGGPLSAQRLRSTPVAAQQQQQPAPALARDVASADAEDDDWSNDDVQQHTPFNSEASIQIAVRQKLFDYAVREVRSWFCGGACCIACACWSRAFCGAARPPAAPHCRPGSGPAPASGGADTQQGWWSTPDAGAWLTQQGLAILDSKVRDIKIPPYQSTLNFPVIGGVDVGISDVNISTLEVPRALTKVGATRPWRGRGGHAPRPPGVGWLPALLANTKAQQAHSLGPASHARRSPLRAATTTCKPAT